MVSRGLVRVARGNSSESIVTTRTLSASGGMNRKNSFKDLFHNVSNARIGQLAATAIRTVINSKARSEIPKSRIFIAL